MTTPRYLNQHSEQTLREGISEYYSSNIGLLDPDTLQGELESLMRQHDAAHVVFGCDTSLRGETRIDTWTVLVSTAGLPVYLEYFNHSQVKQIFKDAGYLRIGVEFSRSIPDIMKIVGRSFRLRAKWPWQDFESYLDTPLNEIRNKFNIKVV